MDFQQCRANTCNADLECRAIVLTGVDGNLSAGGDVGSFVELSLTAGRARLKAGSATLMRTMSGGSKPIVSALEGYAYGAGMALAAASDFVVTATDAKFACAFTRLAFMLDLGLL